MKFKKGIKFFTKNLCSEIKKPYICTHKKRKEVLKKIADVV